MNIDYEKAKEVVKKASMQEQPKIKKETQKKKMGRPTKDKEGATQKIMMNVTPTQKNQIQNYVNENNLTIAGLLKSLLKKEKII